MKLLFLDIDGVLNRDSTKERFMGFCGLDAELVSKYLNWRLPKEDLQVILSSSWRRDDLFCQHLVDNGITWIAKTPTMHNWLGTMKHTNDRGCEIAAYLQGIWVNNGVPQKIAIIDDMSDMKPVGKHLVQTSNKHGLQDKHLKMLSVKLGYE